MKLGGLLLVLAVCMPLLGGCLGSKGPDATDTAFEKDLEAASAKNKAAPRTKNGKRKLADTPNLPGGVGAAGGTPPPNPNRPAVGGG
jgi:hypothetical protein